MRSDEWLPGARDVYREALEIIGSDDNVLYFDCGSHHCMHLSKLTDCTEMCELHTIYFFVKKYKEDTCKSRQKVKTLSIDQKC